VTSSLVALLSLSLFVACAEPAPSAPRTVLLTAFDPFGGRDVNESWEAVRVLEGETIAGRRIATKRLPVVYDAIDAPLREAIARTKPEAVISFGVGTHFVQVEGLARNAYHPQRPLDNAGKPPPRELVDPKGPDTIRTELPTDAILAALEKAKIGAQGSHDAGGYLCNECFYRLMAIDPREAGTRVRGFVHVPPAGWPNPAGGTYDLATIRKAVRIVVEETLASLDRPPAR
jgi:pyroglutamyl-peptidase